MDVPALTFSLISLLKENKYTVLCSNCGTTIQDGDHFCRNCGASLQAQGGITQEPSKPRHLRAPLAPRRFNSNPNFQRDPYRNQIAQLRVQLKQLRMQLREVNNYIRGIRSNYFEFDLFIQRGPINSVGRMIEGAQLFGPYQQRKQLQDQVMQLEHELLPLEQAQEQWRLQQQQLADSR